MEMYAHILAAHDRVKHLNRVVGRREYCVTASTGPEWVVRRLCELKPATVTDLNEWKRARGLP